MIQFLKFGTVGIFNTLITIVTFAVLVYIGLNYILANIFAYALGVLNSFYWNKNWVFKAKSDSNKLLLKFITVNLVTLIINTSILYFLVNLLSLNTYLSQIIATGIGLIFNFVLNKKWTFETQNDN